MTIITAEQKDILYHTVHRAAGGRYCGGGKAMDDLVAAGLMQSLGKPAWAIDCYYTITNEGREALREWQAAQPKPPPPRRLTRSQERYREFLQTKSNCSFGEWLKLKPQYR